MPSVFPGSESIGAFLLLALGFGFIIFVHELGHFLAAKSVGIKVTQFALGFGPAVASWRKGIGWRLGSTEPQYYQRLHGELSKQSPPPTADGAVVSKPDSSDWQTIAVEMARATPQQLLQAHQALNLGETEYRINWVPLGGYVKMLGQEDMDPTAQSNDPRAFNRKSGWARALVILAGVTMNLIFGVVFFIAAFLHGVNFPAAVVGDVLSGSPASQTMPVESSDPSFRGLQTGDKILQIDGEPVTDFTDLFIAAALGKEDHPLKLTIDRPGHPTPLTYSIELERDAASKLLMLGIGQSMSTKLSSSAHYQPPAAWAKAGVKPGMRITHVASQPVKLEDWHLVYQTIVHARGNPVELTFADVDSNTQTTGQPVTVTTSATPTFEQNSTGEVHLLGLVPPVQITMVIPKSPAEAAGLQTGDIFAFVGDTAWPNARQIPELVKQAQGGELALSVWRKGKMVELTPAKPDWKGKLGFAYEPAIDQNMVCNTLADQPFEKLNLPAGSRIMGINHQPVASFSEMQRIIADAVAASMKDADTQPGRLTLAVQYELNIADRPTHEAVVEISSAQADEILKAQWDIAASDFSGFEPLTTLVKAKTPVDAAHLGIIKTHQLMMQTGLTLLRLVQSSVPMSGLQGPLGIAHTGTAIARDRGWPYLLFFFGLISVNLVVFNLLPIPILDGGLLLFLIIEKISGKPVSPKILNAALYVGLALIVGLVLVVTYNDIIRTFWS